MLKEAMMKVNRRIQKKSMPDRRLVKRIESQPQSENPGTKKKQSTKPTPK